MLGLGGFAFGCAGASAMLMFRRSIEPYMTFAYPLVTWLLTRRSRSGPMAYSSDDYPWIVAALYLFSFVWLAVAAYGIYNKPSSDRRVDAYLRLRQAQMAAPKIEEWRRD